MLGHESHLFLKKYWGVGKSARRPDELSTIGLAQKCHDRRKIRRSSRRTLNTGCGRRPGSGLVYSTIDAVRQARSSNSRSIDSNDSGKTEGENQSLRSEEHTSELQSHS